MAINTSAPRRGEAGMQIVTLLVIAIVLVGLCALKLAGPSTASGWHKDLDEGIIAAERSGKPLLVLYTADWCPPCRRLKRQVLTDAEVTEFLERSFVLVKIDLTNTRGPNNELAVANGVEGIPTIQVFDAAGSFVDLFQGPADKAIFMQWAEACRRR